VRQPQLDLTPNPELHVVIADILLTAADHASTAVKGGGRNNQANGTAVPESGYAVPSCRISFSEVARH
jgi:hypothetical protein